MGVGVLIGKAGNNNSKSGAPQVITVNGGGAAGAGTSHRCIGHRRGGGRGHHAAKRLTPPRRRRQRSSRRRARQADDGCGQEGVARRLQRPRSRGGRSQATVKSGGACKAGSAGCQGGHFTGNFFGRERHRSSGLSRAIRDRLGRRGAGWRLARAAAARRARRGRGPSISSAAATSSTPGSPSCSGTSAGSPTRWRSATGSGSMCSSAGSRAPGRRRRALRGRADPAPRADLDGRRVRLVRRAAFEWRRLLLAVRAAVADSRCHSDAIAAP